VVVGLVQCLWTGERVQEVPASVRCLAFVYALAALTNIGLVFEARSDTRLQLSIALFLPCVSGVV